MTPENENPENEENEHEGCCGEEAEDCGCEGEEDDPFLKENTEFGQGVGGGKLGSFVSKMGPILENKDMIFAIVDNAVLPQLNEVLDKYMYGEYMKHKAKYLFSYYENLKEAGFSDERAMKLVELQAEKDPFFKLFMEILPDVIDLVMRFAPYRRAAYDGEMP